MAWIRKDVGLYDVVPVGYRPAWNDVYRHRFACYPIGLHWLMRWGYRLWCRSWRCVPGWLERHDEELYRTFKAQRIEQYEQELQAAAVQLDLRERVIKRLLDWYCEALTETEKLTVREQYIELEWQRMQHQKQQP